MIWKCREEFKVIVTLAKGHLYGIVFYFLLETTRPGCNSDHHIDTATLYLQKVSKFIARTNLQKANIKLKSQDSGEPSRPNEPFVYVSHVRQD